MSDSDALMWAIEKDPMLRSTITTVVVLESEVDPERLHHTFDRVSRVVPRLRQRVRSNPLSVAPRAGSSIPTSTSATTCVRRGSRAPAR